MLPRRFLLIPYGVYLAVLIVFVLGACSQNSSVPISATGNLQVVVRGLPDELTAEVVVSNNQNFGERMSGTYASFRSLTPGTYTLAPQDVFDGTVLYVAESVSIFVAANSITQSEVVYRYTAYVPGGGLLVSSSGLPDGVGANLQVSNDTGFRRTLSEGTLLSGLASGYYTVVADPVANGTVRYQARSARTEVFVEPSGVARVDVVYEPEPGVLELSIDGAPADAAIRLSVRSSSIYEGYEARSTLRLNGLEPGEYVVYAHDILHNGEVYVAEVVHTRVASGQVQQETIRYRTATGDGQIYGRIWHDRNLNDQRDPSETGLEGFTVFLDDNENGRLEPSERRTVSDRNGTYSFLGLDTDRSYTLTQRLPLGWSNSYAEIAPRGDVMLQIIGGRDGDLGDYPFVVGLLRRNIDDNEAAHFCGGTLIAARWVLTAAHCVTSDPQTLHVLVGTDNLRSGGERLPVRRTIIHPNYSAVTLDYDLALLELDTGVLAPRVAVLSPDLSTLAQPSTLATIAGWGQTQAGSAGSSRLQVAAVPITSTASCRAAYGSRLTPQMICAGLPEGGVDACQGDSGGPLIVRDASRRDWLQAGVVSWGDGCARPGRPGVYTRTAVFNDWLEAQIPLELSGSYRIDFSSGNTVNRVDFGNFR
ncbi:MAG: trypsin-like serine protease [Trueperaceae bacterium]|nr:trypsin-like serine protease [Trueperaceae bacterium]